MKIGEQIASYSIMLGDSIASRLNAKWSKVSLLYSGWLIDRSHQFEGYEVAMVDGRIAFSAGSTVPLVEDVHVKLPPREIKSDAESAAAPAQIESGEEAKAGVESSDDIIVKTEPGTNVVTTNGATSQALVATTQAPAKGVLPGSLFVGDLRLANLKNRLSALTPPIAAEFAGEGILICGPGIQKGQQAKGGSVVAVRKLGEGEIVLEGGLGRTYETVRKELYKGFARVVAG